MKAKGLRSVGTFDTSFTLLPLRHIEF